LEQRTDAILNPLQGSPPPRSAAADNANIQKLEEEMRQVKEMLAQMTAKQDRADSDLSRAEDLDGSEVDIDDEQMKDFIKRQKGQIKEL
jgi:hypothetical protein